MRMKVKSCAECGAPALDQCKCCGKPMCGRCFNRAGITLGFDTGFEAGYRFATGTDLNADAPTANPSEESAA